MMIARIVMEQIVKMMMIARIVMEQVVKVMS